MPTPSVERVSVPTPDPTTLTRDALNREIGMLRELLIQRMESIERAVVVAHENIVRVPTDVDKAIAHLKELTDTRFLESDTRYQQRFEAQTLALNAAMQAAEKAIVAALLGVDKAVSKAETANEVRFIAVNDKLDGLGSRMDKRDGTGTGLSAGWAILVSVIGVLGTIIGAVILLSRSTT